jgi:hypothetical protein
MTDTTGMPPLMAACVRQAEQLGLTVTVTTTGLPSVEIADEYGMPGLRLDTRRTGYGASKKDTTTTRTMSRSGHWHAAKGMADLWLATAARRISTNGMPTAEQTAQHRRSTLEAQLRDARAHAARARSEADTHQQRVDELWRQINAISNGEAAAL